MSKKLKGTADTAGNMTSTVAASSLMQYFKERDWEMITFFPNLPCASCKKCKK